MRPSLPCRPPSWPPDLASLGEFGFSAICRVTSPCFRTTFGPLSKIQRRWSVEIMVQLDLWSSENNIITTCASPTYSEVSSSLVLACGPMVLTLLRSTLVSITCDRQKPGKSADLHSFHRFFTCQTNQLTCIEMQGSDKYLSNTIYYSML